MSRKRRRDPQRSLLPAQAPSSARRTAPDHSHSIDDPLDAPLGNVYRTTRFLVKVAAAGLVIVFGWLELSGIEFAPVAQSLPGDILLKFALALYYMGWVSGLLSDTDLQERVYAVAPNRGRMPLGGFVSALLLPLVFGVLCWTTTYGRFALFLGLFLVVNVVIWRYLVGRVLPRTVADSREAFRSDNVRLEKLELVYERYLNGRWQWARFGLGAVVVLAINVMAHSSITELIRTRLGGIPQDLLISGAIFGYVLMMEGWMWLVRLRLRASLRLLDYLGRRYSLALIEATPVSR